MNPEAFVKRYLALVSELRALSCAVDSNGDLLSALTIDQYLIFSNLVKELMFYS